MCIINDILRFIFTICLETVTRTRTYVTPAHMSGNGRVMKKIAETQPVRFPSRLVTVVFHIIVKLVHNYRGDDIYAVFRWEHRL
jgi:hypothetical protein